MTTESLHRLTDRELLDVTARAAADERRSTVELVELLSEIDARRLYLGQGCSSLFTCCTEVLRLSESAAYRRIEAARTIRVFPLIAERLRDGSMTLTVALLRPHLTVKNHARLLGEARNKSKREVEQQIARLARAGWKRDRGRCAFIGPHGRCTETGRLEFHHIVPFARGGSASVSNIALRCRAHNAYESELCLGRRESW